MCKIHDCPVPSQSRAKIHFKSSVVMRFLLVGFKILLYVAAKHFAGYCLLNSS